MQRLDVKLNSTVVGSIRLIPGDRATFEFSDDYLAQGYKDRTLSLSFLNEAGLPEQPARSYQRRLPPWFSNLLPEGALRKFISQSLGVAEHREAELIKHLGNDLPGAVEITTVEDDFELAEDLYQTQEAELRFSLAGVQLKFSAQWSDQHHLTIPAKGVGGDWIVKMPSPIYAGVPENEAAIMALAKAVGIDVADFELLPMEMLGNIPEKVNLAENHFLAVRRFDRLDGKKIHMEDFCQILNLYPDDKYTSANYATLGRALYLLGGEADFIEYLKRLVFNVIIGNGDMHLKNWSVLYCDPTKPRLSPAYDLLTTIPYIKGESLALNLSKEKSFAHIRLSHFRTLAEKSMGSLSIVDDLVFETTRNILASYRDVIAAYSLPAFITESLDNHIVQMGKNLSLKP
ncbi:MAG: HipA domain-containing protein [Candidatus Paracaedibacteraceae bacterium]|nr:HipA domain-containing protein [Candidatus Paracaedibacteraceae bacterium]